MSYSEQDLPEIESDYANSSLFTPITTVLTEIAKFTSGVHYQIYKDNSTGHFYWEGLGDYARLECDEIYTEHLESVADAIFWLCRYSGMDYGDSLTHCLELALPSIQQATVEPEFIITASLTDTDRVVLIKTIYARFLVGDQTLTSAFESIGQLLGMAA